MRAFLDDATAIEYEDAVSALHRRKPVRDDDRRAPAHEPIESLLADSMSSFRITHATVVNLQHTDQPFGFDYSFEADNYAKNAGGLLLVRPRVLGNKAYGFLETKEPRRFPIG